MRNSVLALLAGICLISHKSEAATVMIAGQTAGPTPFISNIQMTASPASSIKNIRFEITPKAGSVTRPIAATYTSDYLKKRGNYNAQTGAILLPVFGLYEKANNTVVLTCTFTDNSLQQDTVMIATPAFSDRCEYNKPTIIQARTSSTTLSYDFILMKNACGTFSPTIIDTDGAIRWVGTAGFAYIASTLFQNSIFIANEAVLYRMEFDGTFVPLKDYTSAGVDHFHHNLDLGKRGIIAEVDTATQVESVNLELDVAGNILKRWDLADIISAAMTAGGDDPTQFVEPTRDWFHNNAATYNHADDSLLVSSRENFVIALDHGSSAIKWLLGDSTKLWYQFPSLRHFALSLDANSLPPIGQHAISITKDNNLLLFDNGTNSLFHTPPGNTRAYSAPRKYQINAGTKMAKEMWSYPNNQAFHSPFCSSVYEDSALNYLVDYAIIDNIAPPASLAEILGLDAGENKIFDYRYNTAACNTAFNAIPVHLENLLFTLIAPPRDDFNADTFNDFLLFNNTNYTTPIWHMQNNVFVGGIFGPTLPAGWAVASVADVNLDGEPDYVLFNATSQKTAVWFLDGNVFAGSSYGPTLPAGWTLVAAADMNNDRRPDYVLFNPNTRQTLIWYLSGTTPSSSANGPTLPLGWALTDVLDFNGDNKPDFLLFNSSTRKSAIWYLNGVTCTSSVYGPTLPAGWTLQGAADFNNDAKPDYVLFRSDTRGTAFWYLNGATLVAAAFGPVLPAGHSLAFP